MIGLVLFGHDVLAESFRATLEAIVGPQEQLAVVAVRPEFRPEQIERALDRAIRDTDAGEGVLVLTDLFGGSPANISLARLEVGRVEVVSGLNLAMLLKAVDLRAQRLQNPTVASRAIAAAGVDGIVLASELLARHQTPHEDSKP